MDVTPPQFPPDGQLETEAPTVTTIGVSWSAGFDNVELSGYRLYRNDVFIAELDGSSPYLPEYRDAARDTIQLYGKRSGRDRYRKRRWSDGGWHDPLR